MAISAIRHPGHPAWLGIFGHLTPDGITAGTLGLRVLLRTVTAVARLLVADERGLPKLESPSLIDGTGARAGDGPCMGSFGSVCFCRNP